MTLLSNMSTVPSSAAAACQGVRRMLSQNLNDELVFLVDDYTPGLEKLTLKALTRRLGPGSTLSYREATFYVVSVSTTSSRVEVVSGYDGGQDIPIPAGAALRVNPRFTDYTIFDHVAASVGALSSPAYGLFGVRVDLGFARGRLNFIKDYNLDGESYPVESELVLLAPISKNISFTMEMNYRDDFRASAGLQFYTY